MTFDWRAYFDLARHLRGDVGAPFDQEAAVRSAVSRAYYAAFCHARNFARDKQGFSPTGSAEDHRFLRQHFQRRGRVAIAANLQELRQWRNKCDYEDVVANLAQLVSSAITQSEQVLNSLR
jgi:hypothetical protein